MQLFGFLQPEGLAAGPDCGWTSFVPKVHHHQPPHVVLRPQSWPVPPVAVAPVRARVSTTVLAVLQVVLAVVNFVHSAALVLGQNSPAMYSNHLVLCQSNPAMRSNPLFPPWRCFSLRLCDDWPQHSSRHLKNFLVLLTGLGDAALGYQ